MQPAAVTLEGHTTGSLYPGTQSDTTVESLQDNAHKLENLPNSTSISTNVKKNSTEPKTAGPFESNTSAINPSIDTTSPPTKEARNLNGGTELPELPPSSAPDSDQTKATTQHEDPLTIHKGDHQVNHLGKDPKSASTSSTNTTNPPTKEDRNANEETKSTELSPSPAPDPEQTKATAEPPNHPLAIHNANQVITQIKESIPLHKTGLSNLFAFVSFYFFVTGVMLCGFYFNINSKLEQIVQKQNELEKTIYGRLNNFQVELKNIKSSVEDSRAAQETQISYMEQLLKSSSNIEAHMNQPLAIEEPEVPGYFASLKEKYLAFNSQPEESEQYRYQQDQQDYSHVLPRWRKLYNKFRLDFPSQSKEFWTQLGAAVEATMSHLSPPKPSSIIILSSPSTNQDRATCFAKKLAQAINTAFHEPTKHIAEYSVDKFDDFKSVSAIHDHLIQYLKMGKAILVENIDQFQEKSYLYLFHAFCENSKGLAHDTRGTFLFTLRPPHSLAASYDWTHWSGAQIARASLRHAWESVLSEDKREAVISRVSGNVLLYDDTDDCIYS